MDPKVVAMVDQQRRVAAARLSIMDALSKSDERDVSVWIAALVESLKRVSDWNLASSRFRGEFQRGQQAPME